MDVLPLVRAGKKLNALGQQNGFAVRLTLFLPMLKIRINKDIANSLRFLCLEFGSAMKSANWKPKS